MMHREKRTRIQSALVTAVALGILALLGHELQKQLNARSQGSGDRQAVAKLETTIRTVERKFDREVLWESVKISEPLFNRDAVRTDADSEAKIIFDDGTELDLSENSLVVLDRSDDRIGVQFLKGSVFAKSATGGESALEIQTQNGRVRVGDKNQKGALSLRSGSSGLEVSVAEGSAQVQTATGAAQIGVNERGQFSGDSIKTERITILLKTPIASAKLVSQEPTARVGFEWTAQNPAGLRVEVARDADFKLLVFEGDQSQRIARLQEGTYYWRVRSTSETSETRKLRVIRHVPSRLESPSDATVLSSFARNSETKALKFTWSSQAVQQGAVDRLEVARDSAFKNRVTGLSIRTEPSTRAGETRFSGVSEALGAGTFYWRIVSRYREVGLDGQANAEFSTPARRFTRVISDRLGTPELLEPAQGVTLGTSADRPNVRFSWRPIEDASGYRLIVASDSKFKNVVLHTFVSTPSWEGELPTLGALYWTVASSFGRKPSSEDSIPASPRRFSVNREGGFRLMAPAAGWVAEYWDKKPEVHFAWEAVSGTERYEIQFSDDPAFKSIRSSISTRDPRLATTDVPKGNIHWRVRALGNEERLLALSEARSVRVTQKPVFEAPVKLEPIPQYKVEIDASSRDGDEREVELKWAPVAGATDYQVVVQRLGSFKRYEEWGSKKLSDTSWRVKLPEGIYQWDVRALDPIARLGRAGLARSIEIRQSGKLAAPELESPEGQALIEDTDPHSIALKWDSISDAKGYRVALYRVNEKGARELVRSADTEKTRWNTPETLRSGDYVWEVAALDSKKQLGRKAAGSFKVRWIGVLEAPQQIQIRMEPDRVLRMPGSVGGRR